MREQVQQTCFCGGRKIVRGGEVVVMMTSSMTRFRGDDGGFERFTMGFEKRSFFVPGEFG